MVWGQSCQVAEGRHAGAALLALVKKKLGKIKQQWPEPGPGLVQASWKDPLGTEVQRLGVGCTERAKLLCHPVSCNPTLLQHNLKLHPEFALLWVPTFNPRLPFKFSFQLYSYPPIIA